MIASTHAKDSPEDRSRPAYPVLSRLQADDVLRYWLAVLRLEEALDVRPQARRTSQTSARPRLDLPAPGQDYFKLPLDADLATLLAGPSTLRRPFDGELSGFFETWLHRQYRRSEEEGELSHLLCFPVVHLARGELAGLLRCGVRLRFGAGAAEPFRTPSRSERQRGIYPEPPNQAHVAHLARAEGAWPFFIDTRLLRHPLGVSSEAIDALFEALRAEQELSAQKMLSLVTLTLEGAAGTPTSEPTRAPLHDDLEGWLQRLYRVMRRLLEQSATRAQAYPVAIVLDGTAAKTTWHLQRELNTLLDESGEEAFGLDSALGAYLTGRALPVGEGTQRALFSGPGLTVNQRLATTRFWGSRLSAAQGPPGTGKTSLILHLCAEALVRQVAGLVERDVMDDSLFVIASSNNRAVDNVIEPLSSAEGLPLALRVGSRQVCEQQLSGQLRQTLAWLKRADGDSPVSRTDALRRAIAQFKQLEAQFDQLLAPRAQALANAAERVRLRAELAALPPPSARPDAEHPADAKALLAALLPLERRLQALSKLCEANPGLARVNSLAHHYAWTSTHELPIFEQALATSGLTLELPLPPLAVSMDLAQLMDCWEEATEICLGRLGELRERIERRFLSLALEEQRLKLAKQLEALGAELALPALETDDALSHLLFASAVSVREAWARLHASELCKALDSGLRVLEVERSLRPLFRSDPGAASWLRKLFCIWGSTLLSLGNCLPQTAGSIARVVIDEAGQCHPAHVVSALMRCEAALVIGDTHQLTPVIELSPDDEERLLHACRLKTPALLLAPYRVRSDRQTSAQALADRAVDARLSLVDHFRCQPEIIALSDALCNYGLVVHTPRRSRAEQVPYLAHAVLLVDLRGAEERLSGSLYNELELSQTLLLVRSLLARGISPAEIAVITPYRGQLERLRRGFSDLRVPLEFSPELGETEAARATGRAGLALGTVHRFQGGERSIVLFSSVVSKPSSLAFLNALPNLLNVAISRAQHHFVCLGHRAVLAQGQRTRLLTQSSVTLHAEQYVT